jgi:Flp pilus assembly protein TadG
MSIRRHGESTHGESGQTIVEFMLVLPFLLFVIMALAEFGGAFYTYITINNATSEAARWASVGNAPDSGCAPNSIQWRATELSRGALECTDITVVYHSSVAGQFTRGSGAAVRVSHSYTPFTPLPALVGFISNGSIPATWVMSTCSDTRLEQRPSATGLLEGAPCSGGG